MDTVVTLLLHADGSIRATVCPQGPWSESAHQADLARLRTHQAALVQALTGLLASPGR